MEETDKLIVFQNKNIRRVWFNDEWWFVAIDIIEILTDSKNPSGYLKDMRRRDSSFEQGWGHIATPLLVETKGGKQRINCVSIKGAFRLIQSIPSPKAEPFKQWLSQVGYERVREIENPELGQARIKEYYELKGYSKSWIDKRLRGIAVRQELTDEWKDRSVRSEREFAILTNEISKATFGKTVAEYKDFKKLQKKNQNVRDHMTDLELIFAMLGEKTTTELTKERNSQGFSECMYSAKEGGQVAGNARKDVEKRLGKSTMSKENFLPVKKDKIKLQ